MSTSEVGAIILIGLASVKQSRANIQRHKRTKESQSMGRYDDDDATTTDTRSRYDEGDIDSDAGKGADAPDASVDRKTIRRGWGAAEETKSADSPFAQRLKVVKEDQVIKFLEDDPYTSYRQHWIERQGQKSFTCISEMNERGCPLCAAGDRPAARFAFNVALLTSDGDPVLKSYEVGPRVIDQLKNIHQSDKTGPLPKHYFAVSRTGNGPTSQTNHQMVKATDLEEDYDIEPLTEDQVKAIKAKSYDAAIVSIPSYKTLAGIAKEELES